MFLNGGYYCRENVGRWGEIEAKGSRLGKTISAHGVRGHLKVKSQFWMMPTLRPDPVFVTRVGRNLRKLRAGTDLSQEAFAEKVGVAPRYIQWIEAGKRLPSLAVAEAMRGALKTTWDKLLG